MLSHHTPVVANPCYCLLYTITFCAIQSAIMIPTFSFLLINHGMDPFLNSLDDLTVVNDEIDAKAFRGLQIANSVTALYQELATTPIIDVQSYCPNDTANYALESLGVHDLSATVESGIETVNAFVRDHISELKPLLQQVTDATRMVDQGIEGIRKFNWILKLMLILLNVCTGFFVFGVLLTKNGVVYAAFQAMMGYFMIPMFCLLVMGSIVATCTVVSLALVNAGAFAGTAWHGMDWNVGAILPFQVAFPISHSLFILLAARLQTFAPAVRLRAALLEPSTTWWFSMATRKGVLLTRL